METLIQLLEGLQKLTGVALWGGILAIVLLFAYKVAIVGSVYGTIKFCASKAAEVMTRPTEERIKYETVLAGVTLDSCKDELTAQVLRIRGASNHPGNKTSSPYIGRRDVEWLRKAIDAQLEADAEQWRKQQEAIHLAREKHTPEVREDD